MLKPTRKPSARKQETAPRTSGSRKAASKSSAILGEGAAEFVAATIDPKWKWHYKVLLTLRERLLNDRRDLRAQSAEPLEQHSMHMADSASDEFDHDLAAAELANEANALYEVDEALRRILKGTYGICEESGKPIPSARLRAVPWTRFGKDVEMRREADAHGGDRARFGELRSVRSPGNATLAPTPDELEALDAKNELSEDREQSAQTRNRRSRAKS